MATESTESTDPRSPTQKFVSPNPPKKLRWVKGKKVVLGVGLGSVVSVVSVVSVAISLPEIASHIDVRDAVKRRRQFAHVRCMGKRQSFVVSNDWS